MTKELIEKTEALLASRAKLEEKLQPQLTRLDGEVEKLLDAAITVSESWSGSYFGYHSELYYRDFERPPLDSQFSPEWGGIHGIPDGWRPRKPDEVMKRIEETAGAKFEAVESTSNEVVKEAQHLQEEIVIELSLLHDAAGFEKEVELLHQIEKFQWGRKAGEYIHANTPQNFMSRDSEAVAQGARVPAHLYYQGLAHECGSRISAVEAFLKLSQRLLRQIQNRANSLQVGKAIDAKKEAVDFAILISSRLHIVANQLQHRRQNRPTLTITDEYDVQDLLHGLLRLHFDDVRPEEWTPSYGGGASRMDFLLKDERIVIEAKMARANRAAKEISEELIIDAARYKTHPDCKTLVCLVYDPNSQIKNPRGIERDLAKLSGDDLEIICIITP